MKKPVVVTDDRKEVSRTVGRFATIAEAEACIVGLHHLDPASVEAGMFGIDAPETLVNPSTKPRS